MYNTHMHESIITILQTSRYGDAFDLAHVETIFQTDTPIPETDQFLIPGSDQIPSEILALLKLAKVSFSPIPMSFIQGEIGDITQEVAQHQKEAVLKDSALSLAAAYMTSISIKPISPNFYKFAYDYPIYPDSSNSFIVQATLPFHGFNMQSGQVRLSVVIPTGAQIDADATKGITATSQVIEEEAAVFKGGKQFVTFFWQNDPDFTIKYHY